MSVDRLARQWARRVAAFDRRPEVRQLDRAVRGPVGLSRRGGFTLVELLVVIGIIGLLAAITIPAVMAAREAARRAACLNHLKQCATAVLAHVNMRGYYPTGGWGKNWTGLPGRGFHRNQPGGWIYNILPYIDQQQLHDLGDTGTPDNPDTAANAQRLQTALEVFVCPSRRRAELFRNRRQPLYCDPVDRVARSDYAINGGHKFIRYGDGMPTELPLPPGFVWPDKSGWTGLSYLRSRVTAEQVLDGASFTYMLGEKYVPADHYVDGKDWGDNESMYSGDERDLIRYTGEPDDLSYQPRPDTRKQGGPPMTRPPVFGSAHPNGFNAVFCDGSTRHIAFDIDQAVHSRLGSRNDGQAVELPD